MRRSLRKLRIAIAAPTIATIVLLAAGVHEAYASMFASCSLTGTVVADGRRPTGTRGVEEVRIAVTTVRYLPASWADPSACPDFSDGPLVATVAVPTFSRGAWYRKDDEVAVEYIVIDGGDGGSENVRIMRRQRRGRP